MWLQFGLDERDQLISVEDVPRGKTALHCPYCAGLLTAKKGRIKAWHFAHTGETCNQATGVPTLPYYDRFGLSLPVPAYEELLRLWEEYGQSKKAFARPDYYRPLLDQRCIQHNDYRYGSNKWEFDRRGLIVVGGLSLMLFGKFQRQCLNGKLSDLEQAVICAKRQGKPAALAVALADLRLYRAQYQRVLGQTLYLLEIQAQGEMFYKVGVTSRLLEERVGEIERDLFAAVGTVQIQPLLQLAHRGSVEHYCKWRYRQVRKQIGSFTEYFEFGEGIKGVVRELKRLGHHPLDFKEPGVINDDFAHVKRSLLTKAGMVAGKCGGRPTSTPAQLIEQYPAVVTCLQDGLSLRETARRTGRAINTVRKVKTALAQQTPAP